MRNDVYNDSNRTGTNQKKQIYSDLVNYVDKIISGNF